MKKAAEWWVKLVRSRNEDAGKFVANLGDEDDQ